MKAMKKKVSAFFKSSENAAAAAIGVITVVISYILLCTLTPKIGFSAAISITAAAFLSIAAGIAVITKHIAGKKAAHNENGFKQSCRQ